jgi:hypothetical protein
LLSKSYILADLSAGISFLLDFSFMSITHVSLISESFTKNPEISLLELIIFLHQNHNFENITTKPLTEDRENRTSGCFHRSAALRTPSLLKSDHGSLHSSTSTPRYLQGRKLFIDAMSSPNLFPISQMPIWFQNESLMEILLGAFLGNSQGLLEITRETPGCSKF